MRTVLYSPHFAYLAALLLSSWARCTVCSPAEWRYASRGPYWLVCHIHGRMVFRKQRDGARSYISTLERVARGAVLRVCSVGDEVSHAATDFCILPVSISPLQFEACV